jgi:hypothetical protein
LKNRGELSEAIKTWFRATIDDPRNHPAAVTLGIALTNTGRFTEARSALQDSLRSLPADHALRQAVAEQFRECERLRLLDGKLADVLKGMSKPAGTEEQIQLALLCMNYKDLPATAVRFFSDAFAENPALASEVDSHRYNAACNAALASAGKGEDTARLDATERARLRRQALTWLRAELGIWARLARSGTLEKVRQAMRHWRRDPDLASVRDKAALDRLTEDERSAWRNLWADVSKLLAVTAPPQR